MTNTIMLDPTAELNPVEKQILPRLESLAGATVGLLDISKPRGKEFLDEVEKYLVEMGDCKALHETYFCARSSK